MSLDSTRTAALIDTLVNGMEFLDEHEFKNHVEQFGIKPTTAKNIFDDYWEVSAIDRMNWDTSEWTEWLEQYKL